MLAGLGPGAHRLKVTLVVPVQPGRSVDQVAAALSTLVRRHEALRTTFAPGDDGEPVQWVHGSGEYTVAIRESTDAAAADIDAAHLAEELAADRFDLARELPVRMGVVTHVGAPRAVVLAFAQLALDEWSKTVVAKEIRASLEPEALPPAEDIVQPLDHATFERSPGGAAVTAAADRYWREQVGKAESIRPPRSRPRPDSPRYWAARFRSRAVSLACARIASTLQVPPAAVLLSGLGVLLGHHLGQPACVPQLVVSNRYQRASRLTVGRVAQQLPLTLELAEGTFAELVERTSREMFRAAWHGRFDPVAVGAITLGAGSHRVTNVRFPVVFNFEHRMAGPSGSAAANDDAEPRLGSTLEWVGSAEEGSHGCYAWFPDSDVVSQVFWIDTSYLSKADLASIVLGTERLLVAAADRDVSLSEAGA